MKKEQAASRKKKMKIGITRSISSDIKFNKYIDYLLRFNSATEWIELMQSKENAEETAECDGLLLTGGDDIHPGLYRKKEALHLVEGADKERDQFEMFVIEQAIDNHLPILGICRGLQIMNVCMGGSLHPDLETAGFSSHTSAGGVEKNHPVSVVEDSLLEGIVRTKTGTVNSYHHQAADKIGRGLSVSAIADDGVVEALEWTEPAGKPFLLLVQWHPERMLDPLNPMTEAIGKIFYEAVKARKI